MIDTCSVAFKRINFKFIYFIFLIRLNLFYKNTFVSTSITSVSKCHYEGDFTVNCKESNELMRTANVINGLHYNDTQCFYNPKESHCHRQTALSYCVDKPSCAIKNDWFSLAPQCDGNSYYSQFNFDCQPAYYMCEDTVVRDAFSGLIYSPLYPGSFRTESSTPCFLTINLPKDHHVEITLDHFDIFKYQNCLADFLEIQEYKEDVSGIFSNKNLFKQRRSINNNNNKTSRQQPLVKLLKKTMTSNRQKVYKWSTVALMCGKEDSKLIMKATSDIINFKFKSISSQHNYFKLINNTRVYSGFKIYFQAIPPLNENKNMQATVQTVTKEQSSKNVQKITQENDLVERFKESGEQKDDKFKPESGSQSSLWIIVTSILLAVLALITVLIAVVICSLKRRGLLNQQSVSFLKSSKQAKNGLSPPTVLSSSNNKKTTNKKLAVEDSENSAKFSSTTKSDTPTPHAHPSPGETTKAKPVNATSKYVPQTNQVRTVLEAEPRKMQAERPALLQDLGKSKLLLKYKQSVEDSVEQKLVKVPEIVKPAESIAKSLSPEKSSLSLKLPVVNSVKIDDMDSGVYTGGSNENTKLISDNSIYGADLVNVKSNPITAEKPKLTTVEEKSVESLKTSPIQSTPAKTMTTNLNETKINDEINNNKSNESIMLERESSLKMKRIFLAKNSSVISNDQDEMNELPQPKLEIVEEQDKGKQEPEALSTDNSMSFTQQDSVISDSNLETSNFIQPQSNQPRRSAFNPLHVILKDRNKYYTTEYI